MRLTPVQDNTQGPCPWKCVSRGMHNYCEPATCSEAARFSKTKVESIGAEEGYVELFRCSGEYLVREADAGCSTCHMVQQIVRQGISAFGNSIDPEEFDGLLLNCSRRNSSLTISWKGSEMSIKIECLQSGLSNCRALPTGSLESRATGIYSAFAQCRKWVSDCSQNHVACRVGITVLPRRVVDIGHIGEHKFCPRLIESDNHVGEYSALSHCWGSSDLLKTTTGTLADRKLSIPWDLLSKTFRDAIIVTHELGLQYIWIDSLCIIQDNFDDWDAESANMGAIYSNSKVTIAAVKSKDGRGGLFQEDDGKVVSFTHNHINASMDTAVAIRKCHTHTGYEASIDADPQPLFTRGWTLQEELLAPRVLYYGSPEIVFQCRELSDCQCGMIDKEAATQKRVYEGARKQTSNIMLMRHWAKLVSNFTARFLTIETDRFPALSGLTSAFENQSLGKYIAGLWSKDLPMWLAWSPGRGKRTDVYVAPSWSWASITGPSYITYNQSFFDNDYLEPITSYLEILEISCEPLGLDPRGAITSGYLTVYGRVAPACLLTYPDCYRVERRKWGTPVKLDTVSSSPEHDHTPAPRPVYCLLLFLRRYSRLMFLVLIAGDQNGQYKRIGIGCSEYLDNCHREWKYNFTYKRTSILDKWFQKTNEQEITLI